MIKRPDMKKTLLMIAMLLSSAFCAGDAVAQEIKRVEASLQDYVELLKAEGYEAYPFDISCLKEGTYTLKFEVKEYVGGAEAEVASHNYGTWKSRVDFEDGVSVCAEKVTVGLLPSGADSVRYARISLDNMGAFTIDMNLKPIENPLYSRTIYRYTSRPFKTGAFEEGKFIPLLLYCSFWYDAKSGRVRCCGEKEIDPLLTSQILKYSPHYYVIGFTVSR